MLNVNFIFGNDFCQDKFKQFLKLIHAQEIKNKKMSKLDTANISLT